MNNKLLSITDDIVNDYKKNIVIPQKKPSKQFVLCTIGLVGAGKTTVLKPLAQKLNLVRISTDEIRKMLLDKGHKMNRSTEIIIKVVDYFVSLGYSVAIDTDCAPKLAQKNARDLAIRYKIDILWIHIDPPEDFIIQKLKNFKHTWLFKNSDDALAEYYKRKSMYHTKIIFPFICTFDTSKENLQAQTEQCAKKINENFK